MRTQLAKAQDADPRLREIRKALGKSAKVGDYIAEPRGPEAKKVKTRALQYRITADNVLVARGEGDDHARDLPVIPDVSYTMGTPSAPKEMTWKHLMLGAVHNTMSGAHRNAQEMHDELKQLVSWWPPESLLGDCKRWREQNSHAFDRCSFYACYVDEWTIFGQ